jgi:Probable cobalt transporter subunit (CbtA)
MGSLGSVLKAAVVAGLIAGAITAGFHTLLLEPLIERAIDLEEHASQPHGQAMREPLIDRPTQRWGLVLGFLLYGGLWGLLFGLVVYAVQALGPVAWTTTRYGLTLALLVGWSVAMLPFLKYPANPPGVGEAETVAYRQGLYLGFLGLSGIGTAAAVGLHHWLQRSAQLAATASTRAALAVAVYLMYVTVVYLAMPANPDPVEMPSALVWPFRVVAFFGLILFWTILGGAFAWLLRDASAPSPVEKGRA